MVDTEEISTNNTPGQKQIKDNNISCEILEILFIFPCKPIFNLNFITYNISRPTACVMPVTHLPSHL